MSTTFEQNLERSQEYLARFRDEPLTHFINGKPVEGVSTEMMENATPLDGSSLGQVRVGNSDDIATACEAAENAFPEWRDMPLARREKILNKVADLIVERAEQIALVESVDTGQAIRFMSKAAIRGAENFRYFAKSATEARDGESLMAQDHINFTMRTPIGPVGVITPWNTPFMLSTWKIAPALATGCTVVHKPAEFSPLTATLLTEICSEAGLPDGVLNCVNGMGFEAGKALTEHPAIKAVAFVGESSTGSMIQVQSAPTLKRLHLELGGKNPVIVFDDADLDRALDAVVFMIYSLNGERCTSSSRVLIHENIYDEFSARIAERVRNLKVGHPLDPATEIGPLIHPVHYDKVMSYFDIAKQDGATTAVGGARAEVNDTGCYVQPTLFTGANNSMRIAQEEIFGPVLTAIPFKDEADAVTLANGVEYGLAAYLWTRDVGRAHRMARTIETGMLWINSENNRHLPAPFGGIKMSGIGRDGGDYSFDFYMDTKNVCVALDTHKVPKLAG